MTPNYKTLRHLRKNIPQFDCIPGCHDCCGPVTASSEEMALLPVKTIEEHDAALSNYSCPHLGCNGCEVYSERPIICRLFGTTKSIPCPHGKKPDSMIDPVIEEEIHLFMHQTRQVLV